MLYSTLGALYSREEVIHDTIARLVSFPERRGQATQVIWRGNDVDGFYTSHLVTGVGRHTQHGVYGPPTGRPFTSRTVADCMVLNNRIYREWLATDAIAVIRQLGLDPHPIAEKMAQALHAKGQLPQDLGENDRLLGQYPPEAQADVSIAHTETEATLLQWLHSIFNGRMLGTIAKVYAARVQYHGTSMRELWGRAAVTQHVLKLIGTLPDASFVPQHICSVSSEEGGEKVAVRWTMEGRHLGHGLLGEPTGHRVFVLGFSHFHIIDGQIVEEWTIFDELAMLAQLKLAALVAAG